MAAPIPTVEPSSLRLGDTWAWRREDLADYPASVWTLTYYFRNAASKFDAVASADGDAFAVSVAKATTAGYTAGWYDWVALADNGSERHQVDAGRIEITANIALDAVYDARSFARKMLDYIEAALLNRATTDQLDLVSAELENRKLARDKAGLIALRSQFLTLVRREESEQQGVTRNKLLVRFNRG